MEFMGFLRENGEVGVRNYVAVIPTVGCVNEAVEAIAGRVGTELEFVIMVIAVSCVKLLSAHNSTQHTSRKHKV
jgi:Altronate dehydratase